jgi:hypothetical protein
MNRTFFMAAMICLLLLPSQTLSQSEDPPKFEIAAEFTSLNREGIEGMRSDAGLGARFTYNLNKSFALEAATYFFPKRCFSCVPNGRMTEAVAGLKAGKRYQSWGIFAKARPGMVSFSDGQFNVIQTGTSGPFPFVFQIKRLTGFATDLGGVLEFYPSRRIVTRFDLGDTLIHFGRRTNNDIRFDPTTGSFSLVPFTTPAKTTHNFQFIAGVGFRF